MQSSRLLALAAFGLAGSTFVLAACGAPDEIVPIGPGTPAAAPKTDDEIIVDEFKRQMGQVYTTVDLCQNDRTDECFQRAQAKSAGTALQNAPIQYDDSVGTQSWLGDRLAEVNSFSKEKICPAVGYYLPLAQQYGDNIRVFFVLGATVQSGAVVQGLLGGEAVWELVQHQSSGFNYAGLGIANSVGASIGAYGGFGASGLGGDVVSNWSGWFATASVSVSFPGTRIGVGASAYCGYDPADPGKTCISGGVVGVAIQASVGLDLANVLAVSGGVAGTYYNVDENILRFMHGSGWLSDRIGQHLTYKSAYGLSAGATQALDILWYGGGPPQLAAALTAAGIDIAKAAGKSLADWCGVTPPSDSCTGQADGLHCSVIDPRAAFQCRSGATAGAQFCPTGQHCASASGTSLRCEPGDGGR